jgi:hypothetical protein
VAYLPGALVSEARVLAPDVHSTDPRRLARMLEPADSEAPGWRPDELGAILRHQLTAPVRFDLGRPARAGRRVRSFADLLHHPRPPLALLTMTKEFAKANRSHPDRPLPEPVAALLYFASILVARLRRGRRITDLGDAALCRGLRWGVGQPWVDAAVRRLFREGLDRLDRPREGHA